MNIKIAMKTISKSNAVFILISIDLWLWNWIWIITQFFYSNFCLSGVLCMIHIALMYCCCIYVNNESMLCESNRPEQPTLYTILASTYTSGNIHNYKLMSMNKICICYVFIKLHIYFATFYDQWALYVPHIAALCLV